MSSESASILRKSHLNITKPRTLILDAFINAGRSLDYQYFLHTQAFKLERTTVFRTLRLFASKKIIYRVAVEGGSKYLFLQKGRGNLPSKKYSSFVCIECGKAIPLDTIELPKLKIPKGFMKQKTEIIVRGICPTCKP